MVIQVRKSRGRKSTTITSQNIQKDVLNAKEYFKNYMGQMGHRTVFKELKSKYRLMFWIQRMNR